MRVSSRKQLLIVLPAQSKAVATEKLDRLAIANWRDSLKLFEIGVGVSKVDATKNAIAAARHQSIDSVFTFHGVVLIDREMAKAMPNHYFRINRFTSYFGSTDENLVEFLCKFDLSYEFNALAALRLWNRSDADSTDIRGAWATERTKLWCAQFYRLDPLLGPCVARLLLQSLIVLPPTSINSCIDKTGIVKQYGYLEDKPGKSQYIILHGLVSRLKNQPGISIDPFEQAIRQARENGLPLRVVEDGLFTATEFMSLLASLLGVSKRGGSPKTKPLSDPLVMSLVIQQWAYSCASDYGQYLFYAIVRAWGLKNLSLVVSDKAQTVNVLDSIDPKVIESLLANVQQESAVISREMALDSVNVFRRSLKELVVPHFKTGLNAKNADLIFIEKILKKVGKELWVNYLKKKFGDPIDCERWDDLRIERCAFGMDGLGLTLAFAHSVPKASLPVFWATGSVTGSDGQMFDWLPLFPNSE